jgi:hypothetical protein
MSECVTECHPRAAQVALPTDPPSRSGATPAAELDALLKTPTVDAEKKTNLAHFVADLCALGCGLRCPPIRQQSARPSDHTVPDSLR